MLDRSCFKSPLLKGKLVGSAESRGEVSNTFFPFPPLPRAHMKALSLSPPPQMLLCSSTSHNDKLQMAQSLGSICYCCLCRSAWLILPPSLMVCKTPESRHTLDAASKKWRERRERKARQGGQGREGKAGGQQQESWDEVREDEMDERSACSALGKDVPACPKYGISWGSCEEEAGWQCREQS